MICTQCNLADLIPIWYGFPTKAEIDKANRDEIILGGYYVKPYTHFCYFCNDTYPISEG